MSMCAFASRSGWYRRLMELFEFTASQQAAIDKLPALLMAASKGVGTPPVRIEEEAVLVPGRAVRPPAQAATTSTRSGP